jgi:hypothetical protein
MLEKKVEPFQLRADSSCFPQPQYVYRVTIRMTILDMHSHSHSNSAIYIFQNMHIQIIPQYAYFRNMHSHAIRKYAYFQYMHSHPILNMHIFLHIECILYSITSIPGTCTRSLSGLSRKKQNGKRKNFTFTLPFNLPQPFKEYFLTILTFTFTHCESAVPLRFAFMSKNY